MTGPEKANGTFPQHLCTTERDNPHPPERSHVRIFKLIYNREKKGVGHTCIHKCSKVLKPFDLHVLFIYFGRGCYSVGRLPLMPDGDPLNPGTRTSSIRPLLKESAVAGTDGTSHWFAKDTPDAGRPAKINQDLGVLPGNFNGILLKTE